MKSEGLTVVKMGMDMLQKYLQIFADLEEESLVLAAKVVAAREKNTSDKKSLTKLDQMISFAKDSTVDLVRDVVGMFLEASDQNSKLPNGEDIIEVLFGLLKEDMDVLFEYYKERLICNGSIAINAVLHPDRAKADKKRARDTALEFSVATYDFVIKGISRFTDMVPADALDENSTEIINFVLGDCENKITELKSQISERKKTSPIVRDVTEVEAMAQEAEKAIKEIKKDEKEPEARIGSFIEMSKYFKDEKDMKAYYSFNA